MALYANVGPDGVIVFEPSADPALNRLPACHGDDARKVRRVVSALARHAYDGVTLLVPGMPEARNQADAMTALIRFRDLCAKRMAS